MAVQDLLSQDEIDALLHGVDDGLVQTDNAAEPGSVKSYDLTSQDRIVRGRMPTLEMINERFARYTRISMFNMLRRSADVAVGGVQVMKFGEYVHSLYVPTSLNLVKIKRCAAPRCSSSTPNWCSSWWTTFSAATAVTPRSKGVNSPRPNCAWCAWCWSRRLST